MKIFNAIEQFLNRKKKNDFSLFNSSLTYLPVNIFILQKKRKGSDVLFFEESNEKENNIISVTLHNNKVIDKEELLKKKKVSITTINAIENFCVNNSFLLPLYSSALLSKKEFLENIIKGGELKNIKTIQEKEEDIKMVLKENLLHNVYTKDESNMVEELLA